MSVTVADIEAARRTIAGQVLRTPMLPAPKLSALTGADVHVKYENLQVTNSFKDRGALNKLASLDAAARARGVIAMSAGNHAQAVAYHAARLGIPATIVMPVTTPFVKVEATQAHGAEVVLDGESVAEAQVRAQTLAGERNLTFVHPYDDPLVIAGQGTIALEMLEDAHDLDMLVIPIGGGGLIAGNAIAARARSPAIPRSGTRSAGRIGPSAARRWRKASQSRTWARSRCRSCASSSPRSCWSTRRISSGRSTPISPCRRPWRKAPARPGSAPCWPGRTGSAAARWD
jgi:threonine dehydratase